MVVFPDTFRTPKTRLQTIKPPHLRLPPPPTDGSPVYPSTYIHVATAHIPCTCPGGPRGRCHRCFLNIQAIAAALFLSDTISDGRWCGWCRREQYLRCGCHVDVYQQRLRLWDAAVEVITQARVVPDWEGRERADGGEHDLGFLYREFDRVFRVAVAHRGRQLRSAATREGEEGVDRFDGGVVANIRQPGSQNEPRQIRTPYDILMQGFWEEVDDWDLNHEGHTRPA